MTFGFCVLFVWTLIIILSMIPKKLSEVEMVFLYFSNIIFELSIFTVLTLNLKYIHVSNNLELSFSDLVLRIVMIPTVLLIASNVMLYSWKFLKWMIIAMLISSFILIQKFIEWLGIITTTNWNVGYNLIMFSTFFLFSRIMTWWIRRADPKEVIIE